MEKKIDKVVYIPTAHTKKIELISTHMNKICQQCNKEFEPKNAKGKFCNDSCKMQAYRNKKSIVTSEKKEIVTLAGNPDNPKVIKVSKTGLSYDWDEVSPSGFKKVACKGCSEPVWDVGNPCSDCTTKMKSQRLEGKMSDKWGSVCTKEEWMANESGCDSLALQRAVTGLYDDFTASELANMGIQPPKWKKLFKTKAEAIAAGKEKIEEVQPGLEEEDYSTWQ